MFAKLGHPGPEYLTRLNGWLSLAVLTLFLLVGLVARLPGHAALSAIGALVAVAAAVPLFLARPRFPLGFAAVATVGVVILGNADARDVGWFALAVLGVWCVLSGGVRVGAVYWAACVTIFAAEWLWAVRDPGWAPWTVGVSVSVLAAILVRHELLLVEQLRAAQSDLAERSRTEERNRIARELHDVIAHTLTVSLLHVSSARLAVEHDPADAARALAEAERLGRQSLTEVRATMGLLRARPGEAIAAPVPGAGELPRLVQQVRDAGADVSLTIEGAIGSLPATTGSTVYRIVQEALTNATRHAPGSSVRVRLAVQADRADVDIDSAGAPGGGRGMGLLSMRERAQAVGGTCTAGPGGRGWLVRASVPLGVEPETGVP